MKKLLLAFTLLFALKNNAQSLILTQSGYEPAVGDSNKTYILDTTAFSTGLMTNLTGSNSVWNYTALVVTPTVVSSAYINTTSVSNASNYPGSNLVQKQGNLYTFLKSTTTPTTQTEFMGVSSTSITLNFTNTAIIAKYPMGYGSTVSDGFSGAFTFSINGNANGNINTTADGTGTLNLPDGITLANVLRVKSVQTITLTSGFFPVGTIVQTVYSFYHSTQKFPVLNINYQTITLTAQSPTTTGSATGNKNVFVLGVKENKLDNSEVKLFPNPASNQLNIALTGNSSAIVETKVLSQLGQCVLKSNSENTLDVSSLSSGVYFIQTKTDKGVAFKKFIKQ